MPKKGNDLSEPQPQLTLNENRAVAFMACGLTVPRAAAIWVQVSHAITNTKIRAHLRSVGKKLGTTTTPAAVVAGLNATGGLLDVLRDIAPDALHRFEAVCATITTVPITSAMLNNVVVVAGNREESESSWERLHPDALAWLQQAKIEPGQVSHPAMLLLAAAAWGNRVIWDGEGIIVRN